MPRPAKADIRCSTVETRTSPCLSTVPSCVSPTFCVRARNVRRAGARSVRRNTMPRVGRRRMHRHHDLRAAVQAHARGADAVLEGALSEHRSDRVATVAGEDGYRSTTHCGASAARGQHPLRPVGLQSAWRRRNAGMSSSSSSTCAGCPRHHPPRARSAARPACRAPRSRWQPAASVGVGRCTARMPRITRPCALAHRLALRAACSRSRARGRGSAVPRGSGRWPPP